MKNKKIFILLMFILLVILLSIGGFLIFRKKPRTVVESNVEKYVAYVKINPSVKLDYQYNCLKYSDDTIECDDPKVFEYQLVNDDAKEIFKDINLLEGNTELSSVIDLICTKVAEKGIKVDNVEIKSDWNNIERYLEKKQEEKNNEANTKAENKGNNQETNTINDNDQNTSSDSTSENTKSESVSHSFTFNNESKETISNTIEEDIKKEEIAKKEAIEKAKKEAEAKAKKEKEEQARLAKTIILSKGVTYCHSMTTYECNNCFSSSLINTLKNAKGHYVKSSSSSNITILKITRLSSPYNSTTFFGTSYLDRIKKAGGEEVGGAGGCDDKLTMSICKQYKLTCQ